MTGSYSFHSTGSVRVYWSELVRRRLEMTTHLGGGPAAMVQRLSQATNDHDLDAVAGCFTAGYRNETPAHPERSFVGRAQVRKNWAQIFAAVPDLRADVLRCAEDGDTVWSEWEHR